MLDQLERVLEAGLTALQDVQDQEGLQQWRTAHLGRKSPLMDAFTGMRDLSKEERPLVGRRANEVRQEMEAALEERQTAIEQAALTLALETELLDVTLPGRRP